MPDNQSFEYNTKGQTTGQEPISCPHPMLKTPRLNAANAKWSGYNAKN